MDKRLLEHEPGISEVYELYVTQDEEQESSPGRRNWTRVAMAGLAVVVVAAVCVAMFSGGSGGDNTPAARTNELEGSIGTWIKEHWSHRRRAVPKRDPATGKLPVLPAPKASGFAEKVVNHGFCIIFQNENESHSRCPAGRLSASCSSC